MDVGEVQVGGVHDVDSPELRLDDVEVLHGNVADIPELEGDGTAWTGCAHCIIAAFIEVPELTVTIDATGPVAVDTDVLTSKNESSSMVLEFNVVIVVAPIVEVLGEKPFAVPVYLHIVDHGVKLGVDVVGVACWEDNGAAVAAGVEGFEDGRNIVGGVA